jgi:hypothetical protein
MGPNPESLPANLSERRFRSYWDRTDKSLKEHTRFAKVAELMKPDIFRRRLICELGRLAGQVARAA